MPLGARSPPWLLLSFLLRCARLPSPQSRPLPPPQGLRRLPHQHWLPLKPIWSLGKTRQPSQEPLRPSQQTAWKDAVSLGPPGAGFYPCPPWKLPVHSHRQPLLIHWTCMFSCHHPTPARAVHPPAWPCSPLSLPKDLATLPWSAPSSPPPTLPRLRKDQSSPRSLGDDSLSFRFRLT